MKKSLGAKTIVYPTPVFIVCTYDAQGKPNGMTAAWGGISCSNPPCVSVSLRKATYTYGNIVARKAFTVNIPSEKFLKEADYFGIASGKNEDKFLMTKLTPVKSDRVDAPYIQEFPFVVECELFKTLELGLHTVFVGEIKDLKAEESVLGPDQQPDIEKIKPFIFDPAARLYYGIGRRLGDAFSIGRSLAQGK
jgi:flavin reductase (DIM6/NTAB) family NADH-FMN oxidoreductase RutF